MKPPPSQPPARPSETGSLDELLARDLEAQRHPPSERRQARLQAALSGPRRRSRPLGLLAVAVALCLAGLLVRGRGSEASPSIELLPPEQASPPADSGRGEWVQRLRDGSRGFGPALEEPLRDEVRALGQDAARVGAALLRSLPGPLREAVAPRR